jgi:hypothetical protein
VIVRLANAKRENGELTSELYDKNIEYRFLVIMRNYIMHYALPFTHL